jgi:hypothetical protein
MYAAAEQFAVPPEVKAFRNDAERLGMICDLEHWYVTPEWAATFRQHLRSLLPIAVAGNPWAQYSVACIYMGGYVYSCQEECIANHDQDTKEFSLWLERCARQGFAAAVDNLITDGVGPEAERLRSICKEAEMWHSVPVEEHGLPVYPPSLFEETMQIAYGNNATFQETHLK